MTETAQPPLPQGIDPVITGPSAKTQALLAWLVIACLIPAGLITGTVLVAWWVPPLAEVLPEVWHLMVGATAATLLTYTLALLILVFRPPSIATFALTGVGLAIAFVGLIGWLAGGDGGPALLFCGPSQPAAPSSLQTLSWELLFGLGLLFSQTRSSWSGPATTSLVAAVGLVTLVLVGGHAFGAQRVFNTDERALNSPQTALTMTLLLTAWYALMQRQGRWPLATSSTATGELLRLYLPVVVLAPLIVSAISAVAAGLLNWKVPLTLAVSLAGTVAILVVGLLAVLRRVWVLERNYLGLAFTDTLTGLANRRGLATLSVPVLAMAKREGHTISVAVVDLVGLKAINDTMGHDVGSQAIVRMARSLEFGLRESDLVARVGGDEFVALGLGPEVGMRDAFNRITPNTSVPSDNLVPDYSVGIASGPPDDFERIWSEADRLMYAARHTTLREPEDSASG